MRLPRFRIRTLMIAVAVVGVIIYGGMLARRSAELRRIAVRHRQSAASNLTEEQAADKTIKELVSRMSSSVRQFAKSGRLTGAPIDPSHFSGLEAELENIALSVFSNDVYLYKRFKHIRRTEAANRQYHERLALKYERAACRPWFPVPPDPPEPK